MKKEKFQTILISLVFLLSISSFAYLNLIAKPNLEANQPELIITDDELPDTKVMMPDLRFISHVFKLAKVVITAQ